MEHANVVDGYGATLRFYCRVCTPRGGAAFSVLSFELLLRGRYDRRSENITGFTEPEHGLFRVSAFHPAYSCYYP